MSDRRFVGQDPHQFQFQTIRYEKANERATKTFNRPKLLNAINAQTLSELSQALKDASWDNRIAVLVLTGTGERAFYTGADLSEQKQFLDRPRD